MRGMLIVTASVGAVVAALAATKPLWFPESLDAYWHSAWLAAPREGNERRAILEEHDRLLASLEREYSDKIEQERKVHKRLLDEYTALREASESK